MIASGIRKKWIAQVTINFGDDQELLELASKAGCVGVFIGFESISSEGLQEVHKKFNIRKMEDIKNSMTRIQRHGIAAVGSFIIGLDIDKYHIGKDIASTATAYGLDAVNIMFLTPLPGTRLWEEMELQDRILLKNVPHDWRYYTLTFPVARYNHLTWREMIIEKEDCYRSFYAYRKILRRVMNNIFHLRNPFVTLVSNLWYRRNTLRLDRTAYENFDVTLGEKTMHNRTPETNKEYVTT